MNVTQNAGLVVENNGTIFLNTNCDIIKSTEFDEVASAVFVLPAATVEKQIPITGMEVSRLMFFKSDKTILFKAVPVGGNVSTTTEYIVTKNVASFFGFEIEALYLSNAGSEDAEINMGYVGVNQ